jgi:hypothetical protein
MISVSGPLQSSSPRRAGCASAQAPVLLNRKSDFWRPLFGTLASVLSAPAGRTHIGKTRECTGRKNLENYNEIILIYGDGMSSRHACTMSPLRRGCLQKKVRSRDSPSGGYDTMLSSRLFVSCQPQCDKFKKVIG